MYQREVLIKDHLVCSSCFKGNHIQWPMLRIHWTMCAPAPGRLSESWKLFLLSGVRNALGLTGFGSSSPRNMPRQVRDCWAGDRLDLLIRDGRWQNRCPGIRTICPSRSNRIARKDQWDGGLLIRKSTIARTDTTSPSKGTFIL